MTTMSNDTVLGRRSFLARAIQLAAVTSPLLSACGGGGSSGSDDGGSGVTVPPGTTLMAGTATVPAPLSPAGASVSLLTDTASVAASGAFEVGVVEGSATLAKLTDAAGNVLVFGYLRAEQPTLSVHSTAEALVFRGLGLWAHAPAVRIAALTLLKGEDLGSVETAVTAAISAGGATWTTASLAGVAAAVNAKVAALIGPPPSGTSAKVTAAGMIVEPTDRISGLIVEGDGIGACTVTNQFRRRALMVHNETTAKLQSGELFNVNGDLVKTEMAPIDGLSSPLGAVADLFFERKSLYTPVQVILATPRTPDNASWAKYKVYAVGLGLSPGHFPELPAAINIEAIVFVFKSLVLDFLVPAFCSLVIPIKAEQLDAFAKQIGGSSALKDLIGELAKVPDLVTLVLAGRIADACQAAEIYIRNTSALQVEFMAALVDALQAVYGPSVVDRAGKTIVFADVVAKGYAGIDKILSLGEFAFTLFDSAIQALDIASSRLVEVWDITVTKAKVTLSPAEFFIEKNGFFSGIQATSVDATQVDGKVFGYRWKCGSGKVSDGTTSARAIDSTTHDAVGYDSEDVAAGTVDTIQVDVFLSGLGSDDPVGSAKAKVWVTGLKLLPLSRKLDANEQVTLTTEVVGMRPLVAGETITYRWTSSGSGGGTLTAGTTSTATYKADATAQGANTITVEAFLGETRVGKAETTLTVGNVVVVTGRVFEEHYKDASGCHTGMYIAFPKVPDAKRYDVFVTGMRGYFGPSNHWYVGVDANGAPTGGWTELGSEILGGTLHGPAVLGGGNGGGDECVAAPDIRWAAWYEGSTVTVTAFL